MPKEAANSLQFQKRRLLFRLVRIAIRHRQPPARSINFVMFLGKKLSIINVIMILLDIIWLPPSKFGFKRSKIVKICANKMTNWSHHPKLSTILKTHSFDNKWTFCQNKVKKKKLPLIRHNDNNDKQYVSNYQSTLNRSIICHHSFLVVMIIIINNMK